jgi:hypothetical protein
MCRLCVEQAADLVVTFIATAKECSKLRGIMSKYYIAGAPRARCHWWDHR